MAEDTIFDRIIRKEIPAKVVFEDDDVFAFHDISPQAPVHVLVLPKKKVRNFTQLADCSSAEVGAFFRGVSAVAKKLGLAENGYRVVLNCGRDGQQTVDYIHAHVIGGRQMEWPPG